MSDIKIRVTARTNKVGSDNSTELDFTKEEWDAMSEKEKEDIALEAMWDLIEFYWEEVK